MKRILALIFGTVILAMTFSGCNYQVVDLTYEYDSAIVSLPDGSVVSGPVQRWRDYEDGDQIQVEIEGKVYLVHSSNVVLIQD